MGFQMLHKSPSDSIVHHNHPAFGLIPAVSNWLSDPGMVDPIETISFSLHICLENVRTPLEPLPPLPKGFHLSLYS
ncbi:hypothetical protein ACFX12_027001 [Malus domestica]